MQHFRTTASARALLAAGQHLCRKDGGDALDLITRKFGEHTDEVIRRIGAFEEKQQDLAARMVEVEQKGARRRGPDTPATWGQQFVHAPGLKSFAEDRSRPGRFRVDVKAITNAPDSGGSLGMAHRDTPALMPRQRLTVRDLLPTVSISGNLVEYARQVSRPTAAATVAEGALRASPSPGWPATPASPAPPPSLMPSGRSRPSRQAHSSPRPDGPPVPPIWLLRLNAKAALGGCSAPLRAASSSSDGPGSSATPGVPPCTACPLLAHGRGSGTPLEPPTRPAEAGRNSRSAGCRR
ncbi:hypothetical protein SAMN05421763_10232 [[Luteovulum] sphaeroides subsp. megalophilum]|uniref:hypothetical protein n=1 Tax=Cereibacter sphaeroides TaxID=1063 RepID=UPI000B63DFE9|nr:hypothetical protein [Cereibacter sphaeroides]SNS51098.1 hypothetical protein SAMN05421763_10232 [[Luteovulum] sphaeroides subsp. megalophilum]